MDFDSAIALLCQDLPGLQAVYLFGSQARAQAGPGSDVDLAVLLPVEVSAEVAVETLWALASRLADELEREVDLVDLRAASTVMRYQILCDGHRLWCRDSLADEFELVALSQYWDLEIMRSAQLQDIRRRGSIHGG